MDKFELTCKQCGARYRLLRRPAKNELECKKCKAVIVVDLPPVQRVDRTGQPMGGYTILKLLAKGPRCNVYRAEQVTMRRTVALKMLGDEFLADTAAVDGFVGHAKLVAGTQHPGITRIYDVNAVDVPYYSMEFVEGATAQAMLDSSGPPPVQDALRIAQDAGSALASAVRSGIRSFRLSADSVMLTDRGEVKILPTALSASADASGRPPDESATCALGSFIYLLLTGKEVDAAARSIAPPGTLNPAAPAELDSVVLQMLKLKKGYASIVTATQALKHLSDKAGGREEAERHDARRHRPASAHPSPSKGTLLLAGALIAGCLLIMAAVILFISNKRHVGEQLNEIQFYHAQKQYEKAATAGEEFIKGHPRNKNIDAIRKLADDSRQQAQVQKRQNGLEDAFRKIYEDAQKQPALLVQFEAQINELATTFSDVAGIDRKVAGYTAMVRDVWNKESARYEKAIEKAATENNFAEVFRKIAEIEGVLKNAGLPLGKSGIDTDKLRSTFQDRVNDRYYTIHNKAWAYEQQNQTDEAIKQYQMVVDKWGVPELAKRAQENINRLKAKGAPRPPPAQPNQPQPPAVQPNQPAPLPEKKEKK